MHEVQRVGTQRVAAALLKVLLLSPVCACRVLTRDKVTETSKKHKTKQNNRETTH